MSFYIRNDGRMIFTPLKYNIPYQCGLRLAKHQKTVLSCDYYEKINFNFGVSCEYKNIVLL